MSDSEARRSLSPRAPPPPRARQNGLYEGRSGLCLTSRRSFCGPPHHRPLRSEHDAPDGNDDDAHTTTPFLLTTVTPLRHSAPPPTVRAHPSPLSPCLFVPFLAIFASISSALSTVMGMFTRHRNGPSAVPQTPKMPSIALPESPAQWASTTRARRSSSNATRPIIPPRPMQAPQMSMDATRAQAPSRQSTRPRAQSLLAAVTPKPLKPILKSSRRATIPTSSTAGGWTPSAATPVETVTTSGRTPDQIYGPKVRGKTYYPDGRVADHDGNVYPEYPGDPRVPTADRARSVAGHRPSRSEGRTGGQDRRAVEQRDAGYTSDVHDSVSRRPRGPNLEPLKGESISLSWPLVEREIRLRRKKSPEELQAVYFDIAFNPVSNPRNLCVQPHGTRSRSHTMPDAYRLLPVSTHCIVTKMYIRCPVRGVLPTTEILVQRRAGVRVIDVFEAIYNEYHRPLDAAEVAQAGDAYLETCRPWFLQRCRETPVLMEREHGLRRVDLMRSHRLFYGLMQEKDGNWKLMLESMATTTNPSPPIPGPGAHYTGYPGAYTHPSQRPMWEQHPMYRRH